MKKAIKSILIFFFFKVFKIDLLFLYKSQRINSLLYKSKYISNAKDNEINSVINFLVPIGSSKKLIRIGGKYDGAYIVPDDLKNIEACFSPGTSNKCYFEEPDRSLTSHA